MNQPKWIKFVERDTPDGLKTKRWFVFSTVDSGLLGTISWFGRWRKYAFGTNGGVFEETCLRDIADFCEARTHEHREAKRKARGSAVAALQD